jgi:hypothetical protein
LPCSWGIPRIGEHDRSLALGVFAGSTARILPARTPAPRIPRSRSVFAPTMPAIVKNRAAMRWHLPRRSPSQANGTARAGCTVGRRWGPQPSMSFNAI